MFDFDPSQMVKVSAVNPKAPEKPKYNLKAVHNGKTVNYFVGKRLGDKHGLDVHGYSIHKNINTGEMAINIELKVTAQVLKSTGKKFKADTLTKFLIETDLILDSKGTYFLDLADIEGAKGWCVVENDEAMENEILEDSAIVDECEVVPVEEGIDELSEEAVLEEA